MKEKNLQAKLSNALMKVFDGVVKERQSHFRENEKPTAQSIDDVVAQYGNANALISGGASLVPGPWGMAAVIPEIVLVVRNQVKMVYDIGVALGKEKAMTKEILAGIVASAIGNGGIALLTHHGGRYLVKRASLRACQKIVQMLAGRITQQVLKSAIAKWLPFVGGAAMAIWTRQTTKAIGRKAVEILSKEIEVEEAELTETSDYTKTRKSAKRHLALPEKERKSKVEK